jgi:hypothetical protein
MRSRQDSHIHIKTYFCASLPLYSYAVSTQTNVLKCLCRKGISRDGFIGFYVNGLLLTMAAASVSYGLRIFYCFCHLSSTFYMLVHKYHV